MKISHKPLRAAFKSAAAALLISGAGSYAAAAPQAAQPVRAAAQNTKPVQAAVQEAKAIHLEAEDATMQGATITTKRAGFSGSGYVTGFEKDGARLEWIVPDARAGIYDVRVRYSSPGQKKGYAIGVNGAKSDNMFAPTGDDFQTASAGKVDLKEGKNVISIERGWGYYDIDAIDLVPVKADAPLKKPPLILADNQATAQARALLKTLISSYGAKTLSGQYGEKESDYIRSVTGKTPAIRGGDLMDYSPSRLPFGAKPEGTAEKLIGVARAGQIVTLSWHWNAPDKLINAKYKDDKDKEVDAAWYRGFYTNATTFDLQKALADPNGADYKLLLRDIDAIAVQLKKFSDAGIPVLWRPLHEAEGGWFWWGAKGPESFKKLWKITFDRLTATHNLHNLVWVYTSGGNPDWYPGDAYVDIVGVDEYPSDIRDPLSSIWENLKSQFDGKKLIALTEFGKAPDIEKMRRFGVRWSYFVSWSGEHGPDKMPKDDLKSVYTNSAALNRDDLKTTPWLAATRRAENEMAPTAQLVSNDMNDASTRMAPNAANYRLLAQQTLNSLQRDDLSQWFPRSVNTTRGGFDQNFATDWAPLSGDERSIVYQSRLTWLSAKAAMRFPAQAKEFREYSRHGLDFLLDKMWDKQDGGFFWELDGAGVPERNGEKHAYGIAFAIYAACANYEATRDPRALDLAQRAFFWLDKHAHDAKNGGYYEAFRRDGTPILQVPAAPASSTDFIGTRYGFKSMNTHIHLLEALSELLQVWPTPLVRNRTRELFLLVRDRINVPSVGAQNLYFTPAWHPIPAEDSYGHDIEAAYLLMEAAHVLKSDDVTTWNIARRLVDHTLDFGFDAENGGVYDSGDTFSGPVNDDKVWWTQAEGLNSMLLMHERFGAQTPRYWDAFVKQWNFIRAHQIDAENGGWRSAVKRNGDAMPDQRKSDRWTEGYHQGRALLNVSETLARLAEKAATSAGE